MNSPLPLVLMVEDSPTQALLLENILERNGFASAMARNGRQALEVLREVQPMLVVTDIQMPEMDGYELCRHIKADPEYCRIPVMLLTSLSSPVDIIQGLECGADNFVVKPFEESFLISRIEAIRDHSALGADDSPSGGLPIVFDGKEYIINSGRRQILNLLLSTYEAAIHTNRELVQAHQSLKTAQAQLIEAEKLQSVGRLASGMAHEIRNPLAIIEMAVTLLTEQSRPEDLPVFGEIREAVRRASLVIDGLSDLSLPRQMGMNVASISEIVEEALIPFAAPFAEAGITVRRDYGVDSQQARVDLGKIGQVFANIFSNARDAMPQGGELFISTRVHALEPSDGLFHAGDRSGHLLHAGDHVVEICFRDSGTGLDPENVRRVFDPFFSTKPTGKGIGLGLTVARKIIELHGGRIEISNRPEGGTEVVVLLRACDSPKP